MHTRMYVRPSVRWLLASGMSSIPLCASHGNVMRACTNAILSGPCNAWLMIDGWMIVMNGSGDAWFVLVKE